MQVGHRRKIASSDGLDGLFKTGKVVGVRQEIAVIQHVDPDLTIVDHLGRERVFQDLTGRHRGEDDAAVFEIIFDGFPGQLERIFETLHDPFFLQRIQRCGSIFQGLAEENESAVKILESLFPAYIRIHRILRVAN